MNILFLGYAINQEEVAKTYGASFAGNKMQISVLRNLLKYNNLKIKCISIYPTASYPKGDKIVINRKEIWLFENFYSLGIGFLNLPIIKNIFETINTYYEAAKIVKNENIIKIMTFNMFPQIGLPAIWLKKKYNCEIITLLADLPIDDNVSRIRFSKLFRVIFDKITKHAIPKCDKIIALNKNAIDIYAPNSKHIIIDGGIDYEDIYDIQGKAFNNKNIVYSGAIVDYSGISNLIESMKYIKNPDIVLDIYGEGLLSDYVTKCANQMPNVNYHGKVTNETVRKKQREAYLLVNPRPVDDPISMVTFPSKIFEYMISGTPVLTTKLNGFSVDYENKLFFVDSNEPKYIAMKIDEIFDLPVEEIRNRASEARNFIISNKTWDIQTRKIYNFIQET